MSYSSWLAIPKHIQMTIYKGCCDHKGQPSSQPCTEEAVTPKQKESHQLSGGVLNK